MYRADSVGCPFWLDIDPDNLRQCEKRPGHGGQHVWHGPDEYVIRWTEKLVEEIA